MKNGIICITPMARLVAYLRRGIPIVGVPTRVGVMWLLSSVVVLFL
jgi:hypothetical protein